MMVIGFPAKVLLASFDSDTWLPVSAIAPTEYVPGARPAGMVNVVSAALDAPGARPETYRVPSRVSAVVITASFER
jgi:hypothetical protein